MLTDYILIVLHGLVGWSGIGAPDDPQHIGCINLLAPEFYI